MITLPKNWKDGIQVRGWMEPVNQFGSIAIVILALKNKHDQYWLYEKSVSCKFGANGANKDHTLERAKDALIYDVPGIAANQDRVLEILEADGAEEHSVSITNDEWEPFQLVGLNGLNKEEVNA